MGSSGSCEDEAAAGDEAAAELSTESAGLSEVAISARPLASLSRTSTFTLPVRTKAITSSPRPSTPKFSKTSAAVKVTSSPPHLMTKRIVWAWASGFLSCASGFVSSLNFHGGKEASSSTPFLTRDSR